MHPSWGRLALGLAAFDLGGLDLVLDWPILGLIARLMWPDREYLLARRYQVPRA